MGPWQEYTLWSPYEAFKSWSENCHSASRSQQTEKGVVQLRKCIAPLSDTCSHYDYIWNVWLPPVCFIWQGPQHILSELQRLSPVYNTYPRPVPQIQPLQVMEMQMRRSFTMQHGPALSRKSRRNVWNKDLNIQQNACLLLLEVWLMLQHQDSFHKTYIRKWESRRGNVGQVRYPKSFQTPYDLYIPHQAIHLF